MDTQSSFRSNKALLRIFTASLSVLISGAGFCESKTLLHLTQEQTHGPFKRNLIAATFDQLTKSQHEVLGEVACRI